MPQLQSASTPSCHSNLAQKSGARLERRFVFRIRTALTPCALKSTYSTLRFSTRLSSSKQRTRMVPFVTLVITENAVSQMVFKSCFS